MVAVNDNLVAWLIAQRDERGWSFREIARRAGISHTTISQVVAGQRVPTFDFCADVARALGEQPETLLRLAGLLPARIHLSEYDDETRRDVELIAEILSRLSPARRRRMARELVHIARLVEEVEQNQQAMAAPALAPKAEVEAER